METFEHDMDDEQPLDLSLKVRELGCHPSRPLPGLEGKPHGQESPLCLIKDCGCNNHGPRARGAGGTSIYDCGKYGPPLKDRPNSGAVNFSGVESMDRYEAVRPCYDQQCIPRQDEVTTVTNSVIRSWDSRRLQNEEERMDTSHISSRFESPATERRYKLPYRTSVSADLDKQAPGYTTTPSYFDGCDINPQSYVDLSISNRNCQWRPTLNNEDRFRHISHSWSNGPSLHQHMNRGGWGHPEGHMSHPHWRPFIDTAGGQHHSQETLNPTNRIPITPKSTSVPMDKSPSSDISGKEQASDSSSLAHSPSVCQSYASTVPLITSSNTRRDSSQSSTAATKTGQQLTVPRIPYTTIRVTRSPKTFHNQSVRAALDVEARTCPFKRPQDGFNRRGQPGKYGLQEKENIDLTEAKGTPTEGVKMPALDYLISKVLVERIDIPFKPCNTEIKKIYNGESKGRLRLVDLIELQVEESLKA